MCSTCLPSIHPIICAGWVSHQCELFESQHPFGLHADAESIQPDVGRVVLRALMRLLHRCSVARCCIWPFLPPSRHLSLTLALVVIRRRDLRPPGACRLEASRVHEEHPCRRYCRFAPGDGPRPHSPDVTPPKWLCIGNLFPYHGPGNNEARSSKLAAGTRPYETATFRPPS
ncbi:hypothetical protein BV20DRAFT_76392 [Pilatotrama ljubarskyi]|nr:hypothetical protein BV20DRAFT_76392 [Pilatotrama ljubarskyi]